jgi:hypothetical protein
VTILLALLPNGLFFKMVFYGLNEWVLTAAVLSVDEGDILDGFHSTQVDGPPSIHLALCMCAGGAAPERVGVAIHGTARHATPALGRLPRLLALGQVHCRAKFRGL